MGWLEYGVHEDGALGSLVFANEQRFPIADDAVSDQLGEYFAGVRRDFDLCLRAKGTTFQREVWEALRSIPYGDTRTYGQIAELISKPNAVRAVGAANGANPIAIVVPCHRVIGAKGSLTGFAGGLERKAKLLEMEAGQSSLFS